MGRICVIDSLRWQGDCKNWTLGRIAMKSEVLMMNTDSKKKDHDPKSLIKMTKITINVNL